MSTVSDRVSNGSQEEFELRRGPWTPEEDNLLIHYITCHGEGRWNLLAKSAGLKRNGKSCRLRWLNYLKPDIKRGNLTPQEQLLILELHSKWGNRWSKIAQHLHGRTDNEIKNYWRTRVQKQARQLKIECNSKGFLEAIRCVWMPRLLEQMKQTPSPSSSSSHSTPLSTMEAQNFTITSLHPNLQAPLTLSCLQPSKLESLNQPIEESSSMTKSIIGFPDSMRTSQLPDILEHPTSPAHEAFGNSDNSSLVNDCYYVDIGNYEVEDFNLLSPMSVEGPRDLLFSDGQMAGSNWIGDDMAGTLWNNMDELWQFRKPEELGI
ncbi:unnamed protein product [Camellia sinensis]|uniref:Uncharacterized protein n=2 Tax=Camellia sinensis TaxID=4442 RepID=A0A4S4EEZ3_CAMSN|nr:transcription factor MYB62-like [Camellia sinensis]THG14522.1 hypothetical protein TEA_002002 [Camellia sinensis var. sinensis]